MGQDNYCNVQQVSKLTCLPEQTSVKSLPEPDSTGCRRAGGSSSEVYSIGSRLRCISNSCQRNGFSPLSMGQGH